MNFQIENFEISLHFILLCYSHLFISSSFALSDSIFSFCFHWSSCSCFILRYSLPSFTLCLTKINENSFGKKKNKNPFLTIHFEKNKNIFKIKKFEE